MVLFTSKMYDFLKKLAQIYLPALGALYFGLAGIWGLPAAEQVVGSIVVIDTFLGVCLGISQSQYNASDAAHDGKLVVVPGEDRTIYSLEFDGDPEDIKDKDSVSFKVVPPPSN